MEEILHHFYCRPSELLACLPTFAKTHLPRTPGAMLILWSRGTSTGARLFPFERGEAPNIALGGQGGGNGSFESILCPHSLKTFFAIWWCKISSINRMDFYTRRWTTICFKPYTRPYKYSNPTSNLMKTTGAKSYGHYSL